MILDHQPSATQRARMTILAGFITPDEVLLAADGTALDEHGHRQEGVEKAWQWSNATLVWGYAGPKMLGERFRAWAEQTQPLDAWATLEHQVAAKVAELNSAWSIRASEARTPLRLEDLLQVLVAGFAIVDGPGLLQVAHRGEAELERQAFKPLAVGGGATYFTPAKTGYEIAQRDHDPAWTWDREGYLSVMKATIKGSSACGRPLWLWTLTAGAQPRREEIVV